MRRISAKTVLPRHGMVRQPAFQEQTAARRVRHRKREALVRLTEGNRLVGVISHVPQLREQIDRKVIVTKTREKDGGVNSVVKME